MLTLIDENYYKFHHQQQIIFTIEDVFASLQFRSIKPCCCLSLWLSIFAHSRPVHILVGGFNPSQKYARQNWESSSPSFGVKIQKYVSCHQPRKVGCPTNPWERIYLVFGWQPAVGVGQFSSWLNRKSIPGDSKWPFDPLVGGHLTP